MKMMLLAAAAAVLIATLLSCGDGTTGPSPSPGEDWMPLTVGNWWNGTLSGYAVSTTDADTTEYSGTSQRRITALLDHAGGFQVYEFRTIMDMAFTHPDTAWTIDDTMYVYLRNTGDELQGYEDTLSTDYRLMAPLPLTLSETWHPWADSTDTLNEVVSLSASITVPAGSFSDCAIIRETTTELPDFQADTYFHEGTGIISERTTWTDVMILNVDLETYSVQ